MSGDRDDGGPRHGPLPADGTEQPEQGDRDVAGDTYNRPDRPGIWAGRFWDGDGDETEWRVNEVPAEGGVYGISPGGSRLKMTTDGRVRWRFVRELEPAKGDREAYMPAHRTYNHVDTLPHADCPSSVTCDCDCEGCVRSRGGMTAKEQDNREVRRAEVVQRLKSDLEVAAEKNERLATERDALKQRVAELEEKQDRDVLRQQADAWHAVYEHCKRLGMQNRNGVSGLENVKGFIGSRLSAQSEGETECNGRCRATDDLWATVNSLQHRVHQLESRQ